MENAQDFVLYATPNKNVRLDVLFQDESLGLTQKTIAELFGVDSSLPKTICKKRDFAIGTNSYWSY